MSIRKNKVAEEIAFIDSILLSIEACLTGYDIFVVLKVLLKSYKFDYFMISKFENPKKYNTNFNILITNWSSEYLMEFSKKIILTENKMIASFLSARKSKYIDFEPLYFQENDEESKNIIEFLIKNNRKSMAMIPVKSNSGVSGVITFTKNEKSEDTAALIELTYFAQLIFEKLLVVGSASAIVECPLIEREIQFLRLLADGIALKKIAESMEISVHTVSYHLNNAEKN